MRPEVDGDVGNDCEQEKRINPREARYVELAFVYSLAVSQIYPREDEAGEQKEAADAAPRKENEMPQGTLVRNDRNALKPMANSHVNGSQKADRG